MLNLVVWRSFCLSHLTLLRYFLIHLEISEASKSRPLKEAGTGPFHHGCSAGRSPQPTAGCLCQNPLLASIHLTGRFPPPSKGRFTMHPVLIDESSEGFRFPSVGDQWMLQHFVLLFPRRCQRRRLGPPCRDPPMTT